MTTKVVDWCEKLEKEVFLFYFIDSADTPRKVKLNGLGTLLLLAELVEHPKLTTLTDDNLHHKWGFTMDRKQLSKIRRTIGNKRSKKETKMDGISDKLLKTLVHLQELSSNPNGSESVGCKNDRIIFVHKGVTLYRDGTIEYKECFCNVCTTRGFENTTGDNESAIARLINKGPTEEIG